MCRLERNQEREKDVTDLEYLKNIVLKVSANKGILKYCMAGMIDGEKSGKFTSCYEHLANIQIYSVIT